MFAALCGLGTLGTVSSPDRHEAPGAQVPEKVADQLAWARVILDDAGLTGDAARAVDVVLTLVDRLEAMLANTTEMITVLGADGTIRYSNSAAGALTGFGEDVNGSDATSFIHPDDQERAMGTLARCVAEAGGIARTEIRLRYADGTWHEVEASAHNCLDTPVGGIVVSMRDVTERNAAARIQRSAHESMRHFVALASHELRTPTTVIKGFADILERRWEEIEDVERRRYAAEVAAAATRLSRLIDDLLILSSADAGVDRAPRHAVGVGQAARRVAAAFGPAGEGVTFAVDEGVRVVANVDQLDRMLHNYLDNALRYGALPVVVEAAVDPADPAWVEVRVIDHGTGVQAMFVPELFGAFSRADKSASRLTGGTGLGLAIVRALARANGGDAWYDAVTPAGSRFVLRLPAPEE